MTITEHIDALDQMIVLGSAQDKIRSQIAFIGREVAVLESENSDLNFQLVEANQKLVQLKMSSQPPSIRVINQAPDDPVEPLL